MFTRTIRFDRVFDIARDSVRKSVVTTFSFEADGKIVRNARISGEPEIPVGADLTVALLHEDAWATLLGWVDHAKGRMVCDDPLRWFAVAALMVAMVLVMCVPAVAMFRGARSTAPLGAHRAWFVVALGLFYAVVMVVMTRRAMSTLAAHRFLSATLVAAGFPAPPSPWRITLGRSSKP